MAYRNGTYVAFHADGTNIPGGNSDIDYYNLMKAWSANSTVEFNMINSHEKASAVRDGSLRETLRKSLLERLRNSKNMVLIGDRKSGRCIRATDHRCVHNVQLANQKSV